MGKSGTSRIRLASVSAPVLTALTSLGACARAMDTYVLRPGVAVDYLNAFEDVAAAERELAERTRALLDERVMPRVADLYEAGGSRPT